MKLPHVFSDSMKSLALLLWLSALSVMAQAGAVWRCGQLLTNQPQAGQACELLTSPASTVVTGTRVSVARSLAATLTGAPEQSSDADAGAVSAVPASASQAQARALLQAELREQEMRWQQLQAQWNQGRPSATAQQPEGSPAYLERVTLLREQMQRTQADMAALRRELARLP
jgi:hypothetical protein